MNKAPRALSQSSDLAPQVKHFAPTVAGEHQDKSIESILAYRIKKPDEKKEQEKEKQSTVLQSTILNKEPQYEYLVKWKVIKNKNTKKKRKNPKGRKNTRTKLQKKTEKTKKGKRRT